MTGRWRTVFFGTPAFAVPTLEALDRVSDVVLVVTQPDRRVGRGCKICKPAAKSKAEALGIEVMQPDITKGRRFARRIAEYRPDFLVAASFGRILGKSLLETPTKAALNVHASLLPRHRGAAPANWAILEGDEESGISIMQMVPELDAGPVYLKKEIQIGPTETAGELLERLAALGAEALIEALSRFNELQPVAQDHENATYARMLTKQDGRIDWNRSAKEIANQIRGLSPWPGAFTSCGDLQIKVHAGLSEEVEKATGQVPGTVLQTGKEGIYVACGKGRVRITELQAPCRKRLDAARFLAGTCLEPGMVLGA
jgi:methionyl-tRNA formyltransferase